MDRREYLIGLATTFSIGIGGCNSTPTETTTGHTTTTATTPQPTTGTSTTRPERPGITLDPGGLNGNTADGVPNKQAEAIVANQSDKPITNVQVRARWYNADGYLLGDNFSRLPILPGNELFETWVYPRGDYVEAIEDVELSASYDGYWPGSTPGAVIEESSMRKVEVQSEDPQDAYLVEGLASNETGETASLTVHALLRANDGAVFYSASDSQRAVPAGDTWVFDMGWQILVRWSLIDDYTLFPVASPV